MGEQPQDVSRLSQSYRWRYLRAKAGGGLRATAGGA